MKTRLALVVFVVLGIGALQAKPDDKHHDDKHDHHHHPHGPPPFDPHGPPFPDLPPGDPNLPPAGSEDILPQLLIDVNEPDTYVDLEKRSFDLERSFQKLKAANPDATFYAIIDGQSVDGVTEVRALPGGTMLEVQIERGTHTETRVVKVEDFDEIGIRQSYRGRKNIKLPAGW